MNVIQLAKRFVREDWGGAETVILETSKRLLRDGHQTQVYCTLATASEQDTVIDGVQVTRFPYFSPHLFLKDEAREALDRKGGSPFSFPLMRALSSGEELDLIHLHTGGRLGGIGRRVAAKRRIPYVLSLHGGVFDVPAQEVEAWKAPRRGTLDWGKALGWWVGSRRVLDDAGAILCVGYPESQKVQARYPDKNVVYLPNGVEPDRFVTGDGLRFRKQHDIAPDVSVILTMGRIDSQKNQMLPVTALPALLERHEKAHVLLIGPITNGTYHDELLKKARELGVESHLTVIPGIAGDSPDLADAYHAADLFLLPSVHEPFGIVILEAWAASLPVVASRVGGIPHFVSDGEDGHLFDPEDEGAFLQAVCAVMDDPDHARALAAAGNEKMLASYTWDAITERLVRVYAGVVDEYPIRK